MIKFEQTVDDFVDFNKYYLKTNSTFIQKYWRWSIVVIMSFYVFKTSGQFGDAILDLGNWIIIGLVGLMVFLVTKLTDFTKRKSLIAFIKNNPQNVGMRQIDYDEEKLTLITNLSSTDYKYSAFVKIEENDNYYFAFTGSQTALILPKRIQDNQELLKLVDKIKTSSK